MTILLNGLLRVFIFMPVIHLKQSLVVITGVVRSGCRVERFKALWHNHRKCGANHEASANAIDLQTNKLVVRGFECELRFSTGIHNTSRNKKKSKQRKYERE